MSNAAATLGVNFGSLFMAPPVPPDVAARQIAALPVQRAKTFSYRGDDLAFIRAAAAAGLRLVVGVPNDQLERLALGDTSDLVDAIAPSAGAIDFLSVGNEPLDPMYGGAHDARLVPAMQAVQVALRQAGLKIGVTCAHSYGIVAASYPPSAGALVPARQDLVRATCAVAQATEAPFLVTLYPFLAYLSAPADIPLDYCLFTAPPERAVVDGAYRYGNLLDAMHDALAVALGRVGFPDLEIVVGETGWPTEGAAAATVANARLFNQGLIEHSRSRRGTPRRPGRAVTSYLFEMYDEANKPPVPGPFESAWGLFNSALQPKYPLAW
ncbi:MAG: hypothetical protein LCH95_19430 [Proteobacteria bacterium]|nr:hypothetical protein [Pseudomonadota bacterium]